MAEYIEREAVLSVLGEITTKSWKPLGVSKAEYLRIRYKNLPAADVRPVVRGRWETVMLDHERMGCRPTAHYCSECHQITWFRTFFCPNCGADMRGES